MTKKEMFTQLLGMVKGNSEMETFVQAQIDLLNRPRKQTAAQKANEIIKQQIVGILASGERATASEVLKSLEGDYTIQKISALLRQMVLDNTATKEVTKGVSYFSLNK